jgi:hypothetical protein
MRKEFVGWLGGHYDDFGFYNTKSDAERAYQPEEKIDDLFDGFKGKKVRIVFEVIEE